MNAKRALARMLPLKFLHQALWVQRLVAAVAVAVLKPMPWQVGQPPRKVPRTRKQTSPKLPSHRDRKLRRPKTPYRHPPSQKAQAVRSKKAKATATTFNGPLRGSRSSRPTSGNSLCKLLLLQGLQCPTAAAAAAPLVVKAVAVGCLRRTVPALCSCSRPRR